MKSPYHEEFERMIATGRRRAELDTAMRRLAAGAGRLQTAFAKIGMSAEEAAKRMQTSIAAMEKSAARANARLRAMAREADRR